MPKFTYENYHQLFFNELFLVRLDISHFVGSLVSGKFGDFLENY